MNRGAAQSGRRRTHLHLKESGDNEAPPPSHTSAPESNHVKNMTRDVLIHKDSRIENVTRFRPIENGKNSFFTRLFDGLGMGFFLFELDYRNPKKVVLIASV